MNDPFVDAIFSFFKAYVSLTIELGLILTFIKWFRKREKERSKYIKKPLYERTMYKLKSGLKKMYLRGDKS